MTLTSLLNNIAEQADEYDYKDLIKFIDKHYIYQPSAFNNGSLMNQAGENEISCKIFAFAKLHNLNKEQTLACFGQLYYQEVLQNPNAAGHKNIRQFMQTAWQGVQFQQQPLRHKLK